MAKVQPSEELLKLTREHARSITYTWSRRREIEDAWLAKIDEESCGSTWKASRLLNMAQAQVMHELNEETLRRLEEKS